jgi:hypothetical protein
MRTKASFDTQSMSDDELSAVAGGEAGGDPIDLATYSWPQDGGIGFFTPEGFSGWQNTDPAQGIDQRWWTNYGNDGMPTADGDW